MMTVVVLLFSIYLAMVSSGKMKADDNILLFMAKQFYIMPQTANSGGLPKYLSVIMSGFSV